VLLRNSDRYCNHAILLMRVLEECRHTVVFFRARFDYSANHRTMRNQHEIVDVLTTNVVLDKKATVHFDSPLSKLLEGLH